MTHSEKVNRLFQFLKSKDHKCEITHMLLKQLRTKSEESLRPHDRAYIDYIYDLYGDSFKELYGDSFKELYGDSFKELYLI